MIDSFWNPGDQFLVWALNVVLQVGLVAALAMLIGLTLRRSSAARYWLLCSALLVVMVCPVLTAVVQSSGLSLISVEMMRATPRIEEVPPNENSMAPGFDESRQNRTSIDASVVPSMAPAENKVAAFAGHDDQVSDAVSESIGSAPVLAVSAPASVPRLPQSPTKLGRVLRIVGPPLVAIWAIVAVVLLMRLFIQWHRLSLLLRSAIPNTNEGFTKAFQAACTALGIRPERVPTLVFSSDVSGPIAAGIRSPKVVFPTAFVRQINQEFRLGGPTQSLVCRPSGPEVDDNSQTGGLHHRHWICQSSGPETRNVKTCGSALNDQTDRGASRLSKRE
ncbi:MAG: hypothetical protein KDB01_02745 [Planctomycetaceae bacterium]|nr:hypothetical protein [Planctomycetaceae bacterium]